MSITIDLADLKDFQFRKNPNDIKIHLQTNTLQTNT